MRRGYTDNREWPSFEHHRAAQHVRIGMEVRIPERIGDEGYPALRAPAVTIIRCIEAADSRFRCANNVATYRFRWMDRARG